VSKNVAVFVDVANLYYSARGQEVDVDYVALLKSATKGRDLIRAYAYSGLDPENENQRKFIDFLNKNGYKVVHKDIRKFGDGRVKANLDIELVVDLFRLSKRMDIAVIVSGDGDFAPAIRALQDEGVRCEVISFRPNTSSDLIAVADEFIDIMKIASIGRGKAAGEAAAVKGMSAPPMPAKEVVPEFGFREASPTVAAAPPAALREGGKEPRPTTRTSRGRSRSRTEGAADKADQPAIVAAAPTNDDHAETEEGRRRRRRRGGRGRGRGGRRPETDGTTVETSGELAGEIGWTEVDDISQIEDLAELGPLTDTTGEEREYTFEEADEATLAELGLLDGDAASAPVATAEPVDAEATSAGPAEAAEEPAPRRRTRTRKAEASVPAGEERAAKPARSSRARKSTAAGETQADAEPKRTTRPRTRSTGTPASTAKAAPSKARATSTATDADAKPARRSRARKGDEAPAAGDPEGGESQGIWQRFRSARGGGSSS
jgi:uncharacterized LabA/DUF88 family protein